MAQNITNWRSLGGLVSANGKTVKDGLLFRCGQLFDLTAEQKETVQNKYHIKKLIDFRGEDERKEYPDYLWPGVDYIVLNVLADADTNQASVDEIISANNQVVQDMLTTYEELALLSSVRKGYHRFLMSLVNKPVPVAFHCFAGKDRTGVAAALILKTLDVSDDQIFADYLKTNTARKEANEEILAYLKDKLTKEQLQNVAIALTVKREYLEKYFEAINKHYGDFESYLTKGLMLPANFKKRMQEIYLT